jgi:hypothetical protein
MAYNETTTREVVIMSRYQKIALGLLGTTSVYQAIHVYKTVKAQRELVKFVENTQEGVRILVDVEYQKHIDAVFEQIVDNYYDE